MTDWDDGTVNHAASPGWNSGVDQSGDWTTVERAELTRLITERERYRAAIQAALNSDLALTDHDPEWRACRDAVMNDLRRALDG